MLDNTNISPSSSSYTSLHLIWRPFVKILLSALLISAVVGAFTALFLYALDTVTDFRINQVWIITLLPLGGLGIGLVYHYWGESSSKGNDLIIEEFHHPQKKIPFNMAPSVLFGTLVTHLFGGSAGREGTAVQMGGAIADQLTTFFTFTPKERKILLLIGISAGFSAVFGTPLAGAVFALEMVVIEKKQLPAIGWTLVSAGIAYYVSMLFPIHHTEFRISSIPNYTMTSLLWAIFVGILCGFSAYFYSFMSRSWKAAFTHYIRYAPFRPMIGGIFVATAVYFIGTKYIGLGIPTISAAFQTPASSHDFLLKLLFTTFTLSAGFKGGEVTPLFFIGATLGSFLIWFVPLPLSLLAGMGFVAVFAGATNTPIASTLVGIELFGLENGIFLALACFFAYLFSGKMGIYHTQQLYGPKRFYFDNYRANKQGVK